MHIFKVQRNPNFYGPSSVFRDDFITKSFKKIEYLSDGSENSSVFKDLNPKPSSNSNVMNKQELKQSNNKIKFS
jgi:hypothetical protein